MSKGKKLHRAVIEIPDPELVLSDPHTERMRQAQDTIDRCCTYDCYYLDCGLGCPEDCPITDFYSTVEEEQKALEDEVLKELGMK